MQGKMHFVNMSDYKHLHESTVLCEFYMNTYIYVCTNVSELYTCTYIYMVQIHIYTYEYVRMCLYIQIYVRVSVFLRVHVHASAIRGVYALHFPICDGAYTYFYKSKPRDLCAYTYIYTDTCILMYTYMYKYLKLALEILIRHYPNMYVHTDVSSLIYAHLYTRINFGSAMHVHFAMLLLTRCGSSIYVHLHIPTCI